MYLLDSSNYVRKLLPRRDPAEHLDLGCQVADGPIRLIGNDEHVDRFARALWQHTGLCAVVCPGFHLDLAGLLPLFGVRPGHDLAQQGPWLVGFAAAGDQQPNRLILVFLLLLLLAVRRHPVAGLGTY